MSDLRVGRWHYTAGGYRAGRVNGMIGKHRIWIFVPVDVLSDEARDYFDEWVKWAEHPELPDAAVDLRELFDLILEERRREPE